MTAINLYKYIVQIIIHCFSLPLLLFPLLFPLFLMLLLLPLLLMLLLLLFSSFSSPPHPRVGSIVSDNRALPSFCKTH